MKGIMLKQIHILCIVHFSFVLNSFWIYPACTYIHTPTYTCHYHHQFIPTAWIPLNLSFYPSLIVIVLGKSSSICTQLMFKSYYWLANICRHHHHHDVTPSAWISLTLSHHTSLLSITSDRSSKLHPRAVVYRF